MADTPDPDPTTPADRPDSSGDPTPEGTETTETTETTEAVEEEPTVSAETVLPAGAAAPTAAAAAGWRRWAAIGAVAAVFLGAFGLVGGLGWTLIRDHLSDRDTDAARHTAVDYAQILTSISSAEVDENFNAVLNGATGEFKDMYTKSSMDLRQLLIDNESAAEGSVVDSAVQSHSKDQVVVLLMVDQKVSNSEMPDPRVDRLRMKMTMDKVNGRWLASRVELP